MRTPRNFLKVAAAARPVFVWLLLVFPPVRAAAQPPPESNVTRLQTAADSVAVLCGRRLGLGWDERVRWIEMETGDALRQFVLTRIAGRLAWGGIRLRHAGKVLPDEANLVLTVGKALARYEPASAGSSNSDSVLRVVEIEVTARLARGDSVLADSFGVRLEDNVAESDLETVERGGVLLEKPERPKSGSFLRWIGPALLIASTGWFVYSFYSIRSQ